MQRGVGPDDGTGPELGGTRNDEESMWYFVCSEECLVVRVRSSGLGRGLDRCRRRCPSAALGIALLEKQDVDASPEIYIAVFWKVAKLINEAECTLALHERPSVCCKERRFRSTAGMYLLLYRRRIGRDGRRDAGSNIACASTRPARSEQRRPCAITGMGGIGMAEEVMSGARTTGTVATGLQVGRQVGLMLAVCGSA